MKTYIDFLWDIHHDIIFWNNSFWIQSSLYSGLKGFWLSFCFHTRPLLKMTYEKEMKYFNYDCKIHRFRSIFISIGSLFHLKIRHLEKMQSSRIFTPTLEYQSPAKFSTRFSEAVKKASLNSIVFGSDLVEISGGDHVLEQPRRKLNGPDEQDLNSITKKQEGPHSKRYADAFIATNQFLIFGVPRRRPEFMLMLPLLKILFLYPFGVAFSPFRDAQEPWRSSFCR